MIYEIIPHEKCSEPLTKFRVANNDEVINENYLDTFIAGKWTNFFDNSTHH